MALTSATPVLGVDDVLAAAAFIRDRLGFRLQGTAGDPPGFAILDRDGMDVFLQYTCAPRAKSEDWSAYFRCSDARALRDELVALGAPFESGLVDKPYGMREFEIAGPENHIIVFGQDLSLPKTEAERQP